MNTVRTTYAIRVESHLDDHWTAWLNALDLIRDDHGTTLTISVADQAQLYGVLAGLRDIGAVLTELRVIDAPAATTTSAAQSCLTKSAETSTGRKPSCSLIETM